MRNIVGQTPRGEDFFPRDNIIRRIYRRLDSGANVYLAAPRRVGKTAIMGYLEDHPRKGYEFKYITTESVDDAAIYFKRLLDALHTLKTLSARSREFISSLFGRIKEINVGLEGVGISLGKNENSEDVEDLKELIEGLDTDDTRIIIMVDEFPQTVKNILDKSGEGVAKQFLQLNREIRHTQNENIRFILTGSIGLPTMVEKLNATEHINDLNTIEIPPLNRDEAKAFTVKLLDHEKVPHNEEAIEYLLDKLEWFIPFHIQLAVQELIDGYFDTDKPVDEATVDSAFSKIADMRNDIYFAHYYSRLKKTFDDSEYPFVLTLLDELTRSDELSRQQVKEFAERHEIENYGIVLRTLEFDGYIFESEAFYRFTSPVLRLWWKNYVKQ